MARKGRRITSVPNAADAVPWPGAAAGTRRGVPVAVFEAMQYYSIYDDI